MVRGEKEGNKRGEVVAGWWLVVQLWGGRGSYEPERGNRGKLKVMESGCKDMRGDKCEREVDAKSGCRKGDDKG